MVNRQVTERRYCLQALILQQQDTLILHKMDIRFVDSGLRVSRTVLFIIIMNDTMGHTIRLEQQMLVV